MKRLKETTINVQSLIDKNASPCDSIFKALDLLESDEVLRVIVPFEPTPLLQHLKDQRFTFLVESSDNTWTISIRKSPMETAPLYLDALQLKESQIISKSLKLLRSTKNECLLTVHTESDPKKLTHRLHADNIQHEVEQQENGSWHTYIVSP